MKKIIFICTGNTCRSPMAELLLKHKLKEKGVTGYRVSSAGLGATEGHKISKNSMLALKSVGIKSYSFKSKQATLEMLSKADLIITMTLSHKAVLAECKNVCTFNEITCLGEVIDPYGQDLSVYMQTMEMLSKGCDIIIEKLIEIGEE